MKPRLSRRRAYFMLVASLPHMPITFEVDRVPISRIRLEQRLDLLHEEDKATADQILTFLQWDRQDSHQADEVVIEHYEKLMHTITNPLARQIVAYRMEVRTIVGGLRRRRLGESPPVGVGPVVERIHAHWGAPDFLLANRHRWITKASAALGAGDVQEVERQLMLATWTRWTKLAERFFFSFESILLYLVRWEIVDRWTRLDVSLGQEKFNNSLTETLGEFATLYRSQSDGDFGQ